MSEHPGVMLQRLLVEKHDFILQIEALQKEVERLKGERASDQQRLFHYEKNDPRWAEIAGQGVQIEFQLRKEMLSLENLLERARKMVDDLRRDADAMPALDVKSVLDQLALLLNERTP